MIKRKAIAAALCAAMILGLAACTETPQETPKAPIKKAETVKEITTDWAKGNAVKTADDKFYVQQNNIKLTEINIGSSQSSANGRYYQISGLKDRDVENSINKTIKDSFFGIFDGWDEGSLPKRRGSRFDAEDYDLTKPVSKYGYCYSEYSAGNILSIMMYSNASFAKKEPDSEYGGYDNLYVSRCECLNFDLNTGKQIKLADLAVDGEGLDYFNTKMKQALMKSDASEESEYYYYDGGDIWFKLVGEFPGFKEDQKYYITGYSGDVCFVLDENTPWVMTDDSSYAYYTIPLKGVSALSQRFKSSSSLFTDEEPVYRLLANSFDESEYVDVNSYDDPDYDAHLEGTDLYSWSDFTYYKSMPDEIVEYVFGDAEETKQLKEELVSEYNKYKNMGQSISGSVDENGYSNRIADITTASWDYYANIYNDLTYNNLYSKSIHRSWCFKGDSTKPMTFEDMFVSGIDVRALVIDAQLQSFRNTHSDWDYNFDYVRKGISDEDMRSFLGMLYDMGFTYYPSYDCIYLTFPDENIKAAIAECFPDYDGDTWYLTSGISSLYYKDLGCSNLTLFD